MEFIRSSQLTKAGIDDYMKMYDATVEMLEKSIVEFKLLAKRSADDGEREAFMANALEAKREKELLENKLAAFEKGVSLVRRPSPAEIDEAQGLAEKLAKLAAAHAQAQALLDVVNDGVDAFMKVNKGKA